MAKVFPLFLVVLVLAVSVLFFMIPTQEQSVYADIYPNRDVTDYQIGYDVGTPYMSFYYIPRTVDGCSNGFEVVFDINTSYKPFDYVQVYSFGASPFKLYLTIEDGYLLFYSNPDHFICSTPYTYPYRLELYFGSYYDRLFFSIRYNHKVLYNNYEPRSFNALQGSDYNVDFKLNDKHISADAWDNFPKTSFLVQYRLRPYSRLVDGRDWTDYNQASYDAGYVDGANDANNAKVNLFPSIIGAIFAFFASIASYEVLGISLLNIMIIVGSVLLLLAVLRVFLK